MASSQPRIAIIGAGPGGLTLGALLHKSGIPFTIYELRPRPTAEDLAEPSGMLDLHMESGLAAIRACGLYDQFLPLTGECEEIMIISDKQDNILNDDHEQPPGRPEISRHNIIKLFLSILPEESLKYNTKLLSATRNPGTDDVTLELKSTMGNGATTSETFNLVIGADGAWSRLRPLLSPDKPKSSGLHYVTLNIKHITARYPHLASLVGKGAYVALGNSHGVDSHRSAQDSSQIYVFINTHGEDEIIESLSKLTIPELKDRLLSDEKRFADFGPKARELMEVAFDEESKQGERLKIKTIATLPTDHRWEHMPGATLIGDAAHLMPPSGEGVNLAMWDALDLSKVIAQAWEEAAKDGAQNFRAALSAPMRKFEETMFARGLETAVESEQLFGMMFSETGAQDLAAMMKHFEEMGAAKQ